MGHKARVRLVTGSKPGMSRDMKQHRDATPSDTPRDLRLLEGTGHVLKHDPDTRSGVIRDASGLIIHFAASAVGDQALAVNTPVRYEGRLYMYRSGGYATRIEVISQPQKPTWTSYSYHHSRQPKVKDRPTLEEGLRQLQSRFSDPLAGR